MTASAPSAQRAARALAALAVDPVGLKGMTLRARVGPARAAFEAALPKIPGALHRIPPTISDTQLFGGLNIAATLAEGRPVNDAGLQASASTLVVPMAERISAGLAARLGHILDADRGHLLLLLDEGAEDDEDVPASLLDRLAFHESFEDVPAAAARILLPAPADLQSAQNRMRSVVYRPDDSVTLTTIAARFGIDSLRAPILALRTARALAALDHCETVTDALLREAAELVYPSRTRVVPSEEDETQATPDPDNQSATQEDGDRTAPTSLPEDILVQAVAALLPPDLLAATRRRLRGNGRSSSSGAGLRRSSNRRGRPLTSRPGKPDGRNRIDPVATLRVAAPWQRLRRANTEADRPVIIYPSDIRIRRFEDRSDRLLIFLVDASGSSAVARLSEAKGAVELLLAQAYAKRDQVSLIVFRGQTADQLLPPTRSLVQGKRRLAALPGGGGTPLAIGLAAAADLVDTAKRRGLTPLLAVLTDGRANITLDGQTDRIVAAADATRIGRNLGRAAIESVVIDISVRPGPHADALAQALGGHYLPLPRADAHRISSAVDAALGG